MMNDSLLSKRSFAFWYPLLSFVLIFSFSVPFNLAYAVQVPPQILTYQGRLANSSGDLLGSSSGTTYYFKFSIWDNATVGSGTQLWPSAADPTSVSATVRQGVFTVNIGDTANGYPTSLNLDFSNTTTMYLQVRVSSDNSTFETLSPRQQITAAAFAQLAGAVVGTTTPSVFGTTTPVTNSFVTIAATSTNSTPLSIVGFANQVANIFQVQNSAGTNLFSINATGGVTATAATTTSFFSTTASSTNLFTSNLSVGSLSGFLKATAGSVATALINLTSDVTGVLPIANGGTNLTTYTTGDILYASAANTLSKLGIGSSGQVLKVSGGVPAWGADVTGSGGSGAFATTSDNLAIYPSTPSYVTILGGSATSTTGNILEVIGNSLFRNSITSYGTITAPIFSATSTTATSTFSGALTVSGTASTTNLVASNSFTFSNVTGFLKAVGGVVSTALVDLATNVTGVLPVANGGTGWAAVQSGTIPYGNGSSAFSTTTAGTAGQVLALLNGVPTWTATSSIQNLTFTYPLLNTANTISTALGTTTSNTWAGTQTFTNAPTLASFTGLVGANAGVSYAISTSSLSASITGNAATVTTNANLSGDVSSSGNTTTIGVNKVTLGMLATLAANSLIGNATGASATPTALATSSLGIALSDTTGTLTLAKGGTGFASFTGNRMLYTNPAGTAFLEVATSSLNIGGNSGTATALETARTINGTSFNGTANITITAASSTLLANSNTFSGTNTFSTLPILSTLSGLIAGNSGALYQVASSSLFGYTPVSNTAANSWTALQQFTNASTTLFSSYGPSYFGATATSSFSSTGALTLASALGETSGGTGQSSYVTGQILYASGSNTLAKLNVGSDGQVLKLSGGVPTWSTDNTGSGGAGLFASTTDSLAVYPATASNVLLLGASATTTTGNILEVLGSSLFRGTLTTYNTLNAPIFNATSTTATSTFAAGIQTTYLNVTGTSATSTFARGIDLAGGCFAINGTCLSSGGGGGVTSLVATYPILTTGATGAITISTALGTTTSNTWGGTQVFTNAPTLASFTGLVGANAGVSYAISTSSLSASITGNAATVTTNANLSGDVSSSGNTTTIGANKVTLGMLATLAANSIIGNATGASATPTALATSSLFTWTGTGDVVRSTSPTLVTPALGTPSALVGTNITGTASGLSIGGNAATASALETARTINGTSFNGTANITITAASSTLLANSNTFSGTNTFSTLPILSTLSGLIAGNSGALYQVASSSLFGYTPVSNTAANSWTALQQFTNASTTLFSSYGPSYFGATATSSFSSVGALTLASALAVSSGGTGQTSFTADQIHYGNFATVATSSLAVGTGLTNSGTLGSQIGGSNASISFAAIAANSLWANQTGASAVPTAIATSSLFTWTGTGDVVRSTSPTLVTPALGTPSALVGTNITGTASGLSIGGNAATVTTNANLSGVVTSSGNTTSFGTTNVANSILANITGGTAIPAFIATSSLGIALSDTTGTLTVAKGGTGFASFTGNRMLYTNPAGTAFLEVATSSLNIGGNSATAAALAADPTDCGANTWATTIAASGNLTCAAVTYAGITAMTSANFATLISDATGTAGKVVFDTSPTLITPILGFASSTQLTASGSVYLATTGGSVGIGTTSPWAMLSIHPNGIAGPSFAIGSSTATHFVVSNGGAVGIGTVAPARLLDIVQPNSVAQLRLSKDATYYSELTVDSTGDLKISTIGGDIRALTDNLWVCDNSACPTLTATSTAGNVFVENAVTFGNGFSMASTSNNAASELGLYDAQGGLIIIFDNQ